MTEEVPKTHIATDTPLHLQENAERGVQAEAIENTELYSKLAQGLKAMMDARIKASQNPPSRLENDKLSPVLDAMRGRRSSR